MFSCRLKKNGPLLGDGKDGGPLELPFRKHRRIGVALHYRLYWMTVDCRLGLSDIRSVRVAMLGGGLRK